MICEVVDCKKEATEVLESAQREVCWYHYKRFTREPGYSTEFKNKGEG